MREVPIRRAIWNLQKCLYSYLFKRELLFSFVRILVKTKAEWILLKLKKHPKTNR